jgi:hypothetical protein
VKRGHKEEAAQRRIQGASGDVLSGEQLYFLGWDCRSPVSGHKRSRFAIAKGNDDPKMMRLALLLIAN